MEVLQPLFVIPGAQDDPFPPVAAGLGGSKLPLDGLEVLPKHTKISGIQEGLSFLCQMEVVSQFRMVDGHKVW